MDRESSRLYREARRAQRQLRGPAGVAAAAELGKAAARAAGTEYTGAARDTQRNALRATAALASGWRPSSVSNGAKSNFAEFNTPSATAAPPAAPTTAAPTAVPTTAAPKPVASGTPLAGLEQAPPLLRRLALTSGAINGEPLLTKEGAIQRVITESAGGVATRSDVLDKINAERSALGQDPIAIDWAKDVASRDIASADRRNASAAKAGGDRVNAVGLRATAKFAPALVGPPASAAPDSWPATDEERRTAATSSAPKPAPTPPPEGLGQAMAADAAKLVASSAAGAKAVGETAMRAAAGIRNLARGAAVNLAKVPTVAVNAVGGDTGKELRKLRKKSVDTLYNKL